MTYESDPPRLRVSGDPDDPFVQALEAARLELPSEEQLAGVGRRWVPLSALAAGDVRAVARARLRTKSVLAAAIALAAAVGVGATVMITGRLPFVPARVETKPVEPEAPTHAEPPVKPPRERLASPSLPTAEATPPEPPAVVEPSKSRAASARHAAGAADASRPSHADLPSSDEQPASPEAETALLGRAHHAVASDPALALALTQQHQRVYAGGVLGQESDLIAIEALVALGRRSDASAAAARFRARYPSSAHLRRIERLLGEPESTTEPSGGQ